MVSDIISDADRSIVLVDGYINRDTLDLLSQKKNNVNVRILTYQVDTSLRPLASAFNNQYGNLEIHTSRDLHDRFIIIDNEDFFHFGHSFKDLGGKGFMFSKIEEDVVKEAFLQEFDRIWNSDSRLVNI